MDRVLKIRLVREYQADDLPQWLVQAVKDSGLSVLQICGAIKISPQYYYDVVKDKKAIKLDTLIKIEEQINAQYPGLDKQVRELWKRLEAKS